MRAVTLLNMSLSKQTAVFGSLGACCLWLFAMEKIWRLAGFALRYGGMARVFMDGSVPCFRLLVCKTYDSLRQLAYLMDGQGAALAWEA